MSQIKVLFFGRLADLVSEANAQVPLEHDMSADELYIQLMSQNPNLPCRKQDTSINVAINQSLCDWKDLIKAGDEVAFLPPVTGG